MTDNAIERMVQVQHEFEKQYLQDLIYKCFGKPVHLKISEGVLENEFRKSKRFAGRGR